MAWLRRPAKPGFIFLRRLIIFMFVYVQSPIAYHKIGAAREAVSPMQAIANQALESIDRSSSDMVNASVPVMFATMAVVPGVLVRTPLDNMTLHKFVEELLPRALEMSAARTTWWKTMEGKQIAMSGSFACAVGSIMLLFSRGNAILQTFLCLGGLLAWAYVIYLNKYTYTSHGVITALLALLEYWHARRRHWGSGSDDASTSKLQQQCSKAKPAAEPGPEQSASKAKSAKRRSGKARAKAE